jgi:Leucine-rich repeat (LRR) protein
MKKLLLLHLLLALFLGVQTVKADVVLNATNFPDDNFRAYISTLTGVSVGGMISDATLASITNINASYKNISSLQGIEYFTDLTHLLCIYNNLTSLDVRWNTKLTYLDCDQNKLTSLDVSKNTNLTELLCYRNQLTSLDVSNNTNLTELECYRNQLTSLDVSKNTKLTKLDCDYNQLTSIDVSKNTQLNRLNIEYNQLTSIDVSKNTKLTWLSIGDNQLTSLDVSKNTNLTGLICGANPISSIDVTKNTKLLHLDCGASQLSSLDVTKNMQLKKLYCGRNNISTLNLSNNTELEILTCANCKINQLDLSNKTKLEILRCNDNRLTYLNLDNNTALTNSDKVDVGNQSSTRRFQIASNGSNTNDCWALYVGTTDASRIRNLKIDDVSKTPTMARNFVDGCWMVISNDLKKIPQKVEYEIYTGNAVAGWMPVTVNYDVKKYGVYIAGEELTSVNFYDIPGLKEGTAYFYDESYGIGWSGISPTLVLYDAKIEGEKGLYNKDCYDLNIIARGDNSITATDRTGFDMDPVVITTISGGGKLWITAGGNGMSGIYNADVAILKIIDGTTVICQGNGYGFFDDGGSLYLQGNSKLACYGNKSASIELPVESKCIFDENIGIRYPVGAYIGNSYHVFYEGTTTDVQRDWVVIGPDNQATQDLITGISLTEEGRSQMEDGAIYNLAGQKIVNSQWSNGKLPRGIYIVGGRKVVIK